jgi:hypothetical protein
MMSSLPALVPASLFTRSRALAELRPEALTVHHNGVPNPLDRATLVDDHPLVETPDGFYLSPELQRLNPPPSAGEDAELAELLRIEGCTDRLVVWREARVLIDGYRRYRFCKELGKPFEVREVSLRDWAAAEAWIIAHQSARRNATKAGRWYLIGRTYLLQKGLPGGTGANQHNKAQRVHSGPSAELDNAIAQAEAKLKARGRGSDRLAGVCTEA